MRSVCPVHFRTGLAKVREFQRSSQRTGHDPAIVRSPSQRSEMRRPEDRELEASSSDGIEVANVSAAATTEHVDVREPLSDVGVFACNLLGISEVQLSCFVQFCVAHS